MSCHINIVWCCHFLAVNNYSTLPQDALSVPLVVSEQFSISKCIESQFFGEDRQEQTQCVFLKRVPNAVPGAGLHGFDSRGSGPHPLTT